jgi:RHS repeat-associated protein
MYDSLGVFSSFEADYSGPPLFVTSYQRDSLGRITQINEAVNGISKKKNYAYNIAGRLWQVWRNDTLVSTYSYDPNGNRIAHLTSTKTDSGTYDAQDRMLTYGTAQYIYTKNGELQKKITGNDTTSYIYDYLGNLVTVRFSSGDRIDYIIDGHNRRIGKKLNGNLVKRWVYSGQLTPSAELDSSGNVTAQFIGNMMYKNGTVYQLITDHLGSIRLVIDKSSGAIAQQLDYDEFGNVTQNTNPDFQPFAYAGGLYDPATKLVRFGARDYDANIGRWTCKDPIKFGGGETSLYGYVGNDPINFIDPSGLEQLKLEEMQKLIKENNFSGQSDELILAQIWMESSFDPQTWGAGTITGLMQVSEGAGIDVKYPYEDFTSDPDQYDLNSNAQNIQAGTLYLENRINLRDGDVEKGLTLYRGKNTAYAKKILEAEKALKATKDPCEIWKILHKIHP